MKKKILIYLVIALIFATIVPAQAATTNLKYMISQWTRGSYGPYEFGRETATANYYPTYLGEKIALLAYEDVVAPKSQCKIIIDFIDKSVNGRASRVSVSNAINAQKNEKLPATGYLSFINGQAGAFQLCKGTPYAYRLNATLPDDIAGMYAGFLSDTPGTASST